MITIHTLAFNEEFHIQHMIDHYRSKFPTCKFVIHDNGSTDGTLAIARKNGCEILPFDTGGKFSDLKNIEVKNHCWKNDETEWVLCCDMDEFVDINEEQLRKEDAAGATMIRFEGYNMVNMEGCKTFESIKYGDRAWPYDKSYLFKRTHIKEINYSVGCHNCNPVGQVKVSDGIYKAYHYRFISEEETIKRYITYGPRLSAENLKHGWGEHYLKKEQEIRGEYALLRSRAIKIL